MSRVIECEGAIREDNGNLLLDFIGVTDKYVDAKFLPSLHRYSVNMPILYRHTSAYDGGQVVGRVLETKLDKNGDTNRIVGKAQLFRTSEFQKMILGYVKLKEQIKDPIKISIGFQLITNDKGEYEDAQVLEYSLTHIPVCKECVANVMNEQEMKLKIGELEGALTTAITKGTESISQFETKVKTLEAKVADYEQKMVGFKDAEKIAQTKIKELEGKLEFAASKKPLIDKIFELEKDDELLKLYENYSVDQLKARFEKVSKKQAPIRTETIQESQNKALEGESLEKFMADVTKGISDPIVKNALIKVMSHDNK